MDSPRSPSGDNPVRDPRPSDDSLPGTDTIVAISTPPGRGGIGVVRLSGSDAVGIALRLFRPLANARPLHSSASSEPEEARSREARVDIEPNRLIFGRFIAAGGGTIDHGYLVAFRRPRSFTGEESAELWAHGSPAVLRWMVEAAVVAGARPATPGEFTLRAFLNGRIDATQAEAIRDLIEARTTFQAKIAHDQIEGRVTNEVERLKDRLAEIVAGVEASIEFSEEQDASRFLPEGGLLDRMGALKRDVEKLAGTFDRGRRVREGSRVAIIGLPNAGKSSLFNRLLEEDRAIVTPLAGTTRDLLEEVLDLGGIAATLIDTAGLKEAANAVDAEAVRRAEGQIETADHFIVVLDWSRDLRSGERALLERIDPTRTVVVLNKADLNCGLGLERVIYFRKSCDALAVSARTGEGVSDLRTRLEEMVTGGGATSREELFITNARHYDRLLRVAEALRRAEGGARDRIGEEYLVCDLKQGLDGLGEITGEVGVEDIYERIFRNFCIGK
ncbi:MAG: tRNA uridine-5-carboxymethylaminomethyl(34) synthesis GTPase MnmE [Acidobacteriota bacterium]